MANYNKTSSYSETPITEYYMDLMVDRTIPKIENDVLFSITATYANRPDLLAFDLYDDADLWWVFASRNPDVLIDPLNDFSGGTEIYLPKLTLLREILGF